MMPKWARTLNLHPEWAQCGNGEIEVSALARVIADRLSALRPFGDDDSDLDMEREDIADEFIDFANEGSDDTDRFDYLMNYLYDWGDTKISGQFFDAVKVCWIKTSEFL